MIDIIQFPKLCAKCQEPLKWERIYPNPWNGNIGGVWSCGCAIPSELPSPSKRYPKEENVSKERPVGVIFGGSAELR